MSYSVLASPWYGVGKKVGQALNSKEAIDIAGLDWTVASKPLFVDGVKVPDYIANVKSNDGQVLGIVSNQYKIVQNEEAFSFADNLISNHEIKYDSAGSLFKNKKVWLSGKLPDTEILGNKVENYLIFTNNHDGKGSIRIAIIPVMTKYKCPLNLPLANADRSWSTIHSGNLEKKMQQAKETLTFSQSYLDELTSVTAKLAETKTTEKQRKAFMEKLFPINPNDGDKRIENIMELREGLQRIIDANTDYKNTQWELISSVSIMIANMESRRKSDTYEENKFNGIICGNWILDKAYRILK